MATLSEEDRLGVRSEYAGELSKVLEEIGITKPELKAAIDALDDWLNTNAATINNALPQPAKSVLTVSQKARLLTHVVHKRYVKGS